MTDLPKAVVFGGTGFLGRRIVRHLLDHGFAVRVAARHRQPGEAISAKSSALEFVRADVNDDQSVHAAVQGAIGVVNAVSLYVEQGDQTFHSVHVEAAARVARHAAKVGAQRLIHVSGIGADAASRSPYIQSRGQGENAVRAAFPNAIIVRPAVMFGPDDALLTQLAGLLRRLPAFPMFGLGRTKLQPSYVEDVAEAIAGAFDKRETVYELGGPRIYTYNELLLTIAGHLHIRRLFFPVPFTVWHMLAFVAERLPRPPITRNQVELMAIDSVACAARPGFRALGIEPRGIEAVLGSERREASLSH